MSTGDIIAVVAAVFAGVAALFAGLSWWTSRGALTVSKEAAASAETSATAATTSADAAERSAAAAEEELALAHAARDQEERARRVATTTPEFTLRDLEWRAATRAESLQLYLVSREPLVESVNITITGAPGLGKYGSGIRDAAKLRWERPLPGEVYAVTFDRAGPHTPVTLQLECILGDPYDGETRIVDLRVV